MNKFGNIEVGDFVKSSSMYLNLIKGEPFCGEVLRIWEHAGNKNIMVAVQIDNAIKSYGIDCVEFSHKKCSENPNKIQLYDYVRTNCEYSRVFSNHKTYEGVVQEICNSSSGYIATVEDTDGFTRKVNVTLLDVVKKFNCFNKGDYVKFKFDGHCIRKGTVISTACQMACVETKEHDRFRVCYSDMRHAIKKQDCYEPNPCKFKKGDLVKWSHCGNIKWGRISKIASDLAWIDSDKEYIISLSELDKHGMSPLYNPDYITKNMLEVYKAQTQRELHDHLTHRNTEVVQNLMKFEGRLSKLENNSDLSMTKTWLVLAVGLGVFNLIIFLYSILN